MAARVLASIFTSGVFALFCYSATPEAIVLQIQDEIAAGRLELAADALNKAIEADNRNGGLYNLRGVIEASRNQLDDAIASFKQAIQLNPRLVSAYLNLGRACELLSGQVPGLIDTAIVQYKALLQMNPDAHEARLQLAKLLAGSGAYSASIRELDALPASIASTALPLSIRSADLAGSGKISAAAVLIRQLRAAPEFGSTALDLLLPALQKSNANAVIIELLNDMDQRQPLSPVHLYALGIAYMRDGKLSKARLNFERLVTVSPNDTRPLLALAQVARRENDIKGALGYVAHARALMPADPKIHFFFGMLCVELNLPVEAKKSLDQALSLEPDNATYNYARGSIELQGRSAWQAIPYFKKFVAAQPENPRGHFALGVAEFASKDYDSAAQEFTAVAAKKETKAGAEYFLGRIAKAESNWESASTHFEKSIAAEPNYADSHAELSLARLHLKDHSGARAEIGKALQLNPDSYIANGNLLTLLQATKDPGVTAQEEKMRELDKKRAEQQELMLRTIRIGHPSSK